jgi:hypothetical protein
MKLFRYIPAALAVLVLATGAGVASASPNQVIRDCNEDGDLDRNYSDGDLREAEQNLPSDIDEYTDCRDVIRDARTGGPGSSRRGPGSLSGNPAFSTAEGAQAASQADKDALEDATRDRGASARDAAAVTLGGERVTPGAGDGFEAARTAANELPLPVLLVLASLAALSLAAGLALARRRWPETRRVAHRLFRRGRF